MQTFEILERHSLFVLFSTTAIVSRKSSKSNTSNGYIHFKMIQLCNVSMRPKTIVNWVVGIHDKVGSENTVVRGSREVI